MNYEHQHADGYSTIRNAEEKLVALLTERETFTLERLAEVTDEETRARLTRDLARLRRRLEQLTTRDDQ